MTKEEKEKLIELSSLNRADNIKYISSEAQWIAIALDSDRLAPSMCKLERAYICGRRKSEKQIQIDAKQIRALQKQNGELTDENERLKGDLELWESGACRATNLDKCSVVKELKARIEKMKCCGNCQKLRGRFDSKTNINILYCSDSDMKQIEVGFQMCCCKWEMKENE